MSKDYRNSFVTSCEASLVNHFDRDQVALISHVIIKTLSDYEIVDRCTDLVVYDDSNDKLIRRYKACLMIDGKSENTIFQYTRTIRLLSDTIGKPFTEMGAYDVRFYLALEMERGISETTRETARSQICAFFQWLVNEEILQANPMAKLKPIKCPVEIKKPFSEVEIDALRSACKNKKERALIEFLLSTGVRVSELASMEIKDIDTNTLSVHVMHGKGNKERVTYMTTVALKHLKAYLNTRKDTGTALFYNKNGDPLEPGGIRFILNTIAERANVENVHPHRFRRTFATNLSRRGMEIQEIQKLLGHSDISTTMIYVSVDETKVSNSYRRYTA